MASVKGITRENAPYFANRIEMRHQTTRDMQHPGGSAIFRFRNMTTTQTYYPTLARVLFRGNAQTAHHLMCGYNDMRKIGTSNKQRHNDLSADSIIKEIKPNSNNPPLELSISNSITTSYLLLRENCCVMLLVHGIHRYSVR